MEEIKRLKSYFNFVKQKSKNPEFINRLLDDIDTLEALIDALKHHAKDDRYRQLAAKMLLAFWPTTDHAVHRLADMPLEAFAYERAELHAPAGIETIQLYDRVLAQHMETVQQTALLQVDELAERSAYAHI